MDWKKRIIRYSKRVLYPLVSGCITFFLVKGINFILNNLDPGWLIIFLMPIAQIVLPLCVAFFSLCRRMYKEAEEDGDLEEILKTTPPIFKRRAKADLPEEDEIPNINSEETCAAADYNEPESPKTFSQEKVSQDIAQQIVNKAEKETVQEQISEPAINDNSDEAKSDPALEVPPVPDVHTEAEELESQTVESTVSPSTPKNMPTTCDADTDTEETPSNGQEPDMFDRIRDPEIMAHYIVLDIETTGFSRDNDKIIEIAAIHYVFGEEATRFHTFINPQMQIPRHITNLTGIQQHDVDDAPLIEDIADDFREFIKAYPLVGHNIIDFDLPFLEKSISLDKPHFTIDTLDMSRSVFPLLPSHKLSDLNFWFHLNDGDPHRADADAAATNTLMWACLYPEKYASLYRRAIRTGLPEAEYTHKPRMHYRSNRICVAEITANPNQNDRFKPLLGKKIVFTGELSIPRSDAMQMAVDAGALLRSSVSRKTDILVVGKQDLSVVGDDGMSTKQEKALEINTSGKGAVKIIDETEFIAMVSFVSESGTT